MNDFKRVKVDSEHTSKLLAIGESVGLVPGSRSFWKTSTEVAINAVAKMQLLDSPIFNEVLSQCKAANNES